MSKTYVDGAVVRNNPVRVALEEEKSIWGLRSRPDIVLSIGTGIAVDGKSGEILERREERHKILKQLIPAGIRKAIDTSIDMVASTLDCHREWKDFLEANRDLGGRCHRLDVGLPGQPPKLDDIDHLDLLELSSKRYLDPKSQLPYYDRDVRNSPPMLPIPHFCLSPGAALHAGDA